MARYFFDVADGDIVHDDDGLEFDDVRSASREALRSLPDLARDLHLSTTGEKLSVTMRDDHGVPIYRATLTIQDEWLQDEP